jgi:hypothetical protein
MNRPTQYRVDDQPNPDIDDNGLDPLAPQASKPNVPKKKTGLKIAAITIIGLILIGGIAYFIGHKPAKPKGHVTSQKIIQVTQPNTSATTIKYLSNGSDLNLSFVYPKNWSVTPPSNDNKNDNTITLTSPLTTIINSDSSSVAGKIVIQVRPGNDTVSELNSNSPITSLASTQIAYSQPTSNQTSYPFISFIHFSDGSKATGAFEEVMITGGLSFSQGQSISAEDVSGLDPIISANFYQCANQACSGTNQSFLSINLDTWQNTTIFKQVLAIFESFQLN